MTTNTIEKIYLPSKLEELPKHSNAGFEHFVQAVGEGRLRPGATFTQAKLCEILNMSLSPLRETLVLLEEYGLIEVKHRAGVTIVNPELSFVRENYQFRILIEIEALSSFVANVSDEWIDTVREAQTKILNDLLGNTNTSDVMVAFVALDQFIHSNIVEALGNKSIETTHQRLQQNIRMVRTIHQTAAYKNNLLNAGQEHLDLFDLISARNIPGASESLRRHFESSIYRAVVNP